MDTHEKKVCPATWFSGFFGLAALVHLIRLLLRLSVTLGNFAVPMSLSVLVFLVAGAISLFLLWVSLKRPCCKKE